MASPPFYDDISPSGSQDRSDRENSSHKRRRLTAEASPPRMAMNDPYHATNPGGQPEVFFQPAYVLPVTDGFSNMPGDGYWPDQAALEYLVTNSGPTFVHHARNLHAPTFPTNPAGNEPLPPPQALMSHHPIPLPSGRSVDMFSLGMHLPDDFFRKQFHLAGPPARPTFRYLSENEMRAPVATASHPAPLPPNPNTSTPSQMVPLPHRRTASASATTPANNKNMVKLVLSRATSESIEKLDELKRECPACQLDFEPDNFMATISCCGTVMHATCLSAWVNSQTYQKSRTCMKCRKSIDARRPLNTVVPPVSDKSWDDGADLNAPESLKGDTQIELNITGRSVRSGYRHIRGASGYLPQYRAMRGAPVPSLDQAMVEETRRAIDRARNEYVVEMEAMKGNIRACHEVRRKAADDERTAARTLLEAQAARGRGVSVDIVPLAQRWELTKAAKGAAEERFCKLQRDMEFLQRSQFNRLTGLAEAAWAESARQGGRERGYGDEEVARHREEEVARHREEEVARSVASSASAYSSGGTTSRTSTSP
ncbi:hypothetical protein PV08_04686 [Exophiala spinifera]|uniref:RING-type domain-containing protein n=1 Tax=Exophiala spinifera TaxID=91928 RepID=A0A0D1ZXZ7_9EURO|nr:uncharacterized protein PV08_04686 [Exophiala spinifera]KIW17492.1 hypothetical protein PV08_04686 [Exophiala spinifera]